MDSVSFSVMYFGNDICYIDSGSSDNDDNIQLADVALSLPEPEPEPEQELVELDSLSDLEGLDLVGLEQPVERRCVVDTRDTGCCFALHRFFTSSRCPIGGCALWLWVYLVLVVLLIALVVAISVAYARENFSLWRALALASASYVCVLMFFCGFASWDQYFSGNYSLLT